MSETKWTPGPWSYKDVAGAGLEIYGLVHLAKAVELPLGIPLVPINIGGMTQPQNVQIAYERWVQFEPKGWHEMQEANIRLMAAAPVLYEALEKMLLSCPSEHSENIEGCMACEAFRDGTAALKLAKGE